jgi:putative PIN family toxin of toxin-antitoxin system
VCRDERVDSNVLHFDSIYAIFIIMLITIDTNIVYQALRSSNGASFALFQLIRSGEIHMALSHPVFLEYEEVLTREKSLYAFGLTLDEIKRILRFIAFISEKYEPKFLFRPNLRDEDDNMFVELAVVSQSTYIITKNIKDFRACELRFDCFKVINPSDFLKMWRK